MIRLPSQAGTFYAGSRNGLRKQIEECFIHKFDSNPLPNFEDGPRKLVSLVCPHAGHIFSWPVAAHVYYFAANDG